MRWMRLDHGDSDCLAADRTGFRDVAFRHVTSFSPTPGEGDGRPQRLLVKADGTGRLINGGAATKGCSFNVTVSRPL
jgi:hypothetical protein